MHEDLKDPASVRATACVTGVCIAFWNQEFTEKSVDLIACVHLQQLVEACGEPVPQAADFRCFFLQFLPLFFCLNYNAF